MDAKNPTTARHGMLDRAAMPEFKCGEQEFTIEMKLGEGATSKVFIATAKCNPKFKIAVKLMPRKHRKLAWTEYQILRKLNHKNIVRLVDKFSPSKGDIRCGITMNYIPGDDLYGIRFCGSLYYLAPEIVRVSKSKPYNRKLDVWSMGVVAFTLSCGFLPFCFDNRVDTMKAICCGTLVFPFWVEESITKIIRKMLDPNPTTRPDSNKLVQYFEYLESICSNRTSRFFTLPLYRLLELSMEENCRKQSVMFKKEPLVSTSRSHEDLIQNCRSPHKKAARCRIVTVGDDATASNAPLQKRPLSTPLLSRKFSSSPRNCVTLEDQLREKVSKTNDS
eukprot:jgi/Bigna1/136282/aug1.33_g10990